MPVNLSVIKSSKVVGRMVELNETTQTFQDGRTREVIVLVVHCTDGRVLRDTIGASPQSPKHREFRNAAMAIAEEHGESALLGPLYWENRYKEGSEPRFSYSVWVPVGVAEPLADEEDLNMALDLMQFGQPTSESPTPIPAAMEEAFATTEERISRFKQYGGIIGWCIRLSALGLLDGTVQDDVFYITAFNISA